MTTIKALIKCTTAAAITQYRGWERVVSTILWPDLLTVELHRKDVVDEAYQRIKLRYTVVFKAARTEHTVWRLGGFLVTSTKN